MNSLDIEQKNLTIKITPKPKKQAVQETVQETVQHPRQDIFNQCGIEFLKTIKKNSVDLAL